MHDPVVPRMDKPPTMPSRGFQVFSASASPPGIEISISTSRPPSSAMTRSIICRGTGLIAGSPGAIGNPALVTMPTPGPARKVTPRPPSRTVATIIAPWVTSGSSPASLTIPALAQPSPVSSSASGKAGVSPLGRVMVTGSGNSPVRNAANAAFTAAVAHAPVVQPRLNSPSGFSNRIRALYKAAMGLGPTKRIGDWVSASDQQTGFARLDNETFPAFEPGWVWLVGAGPGAPGLMSLLCYHALQTCDVVVYDALVNPDILRWVKLGAELEYAGKRGGKPSPTQKDITLRLIDLARAGKRVLRLKGGDPFMFGRGGEECQHLAQTGIPFRIIPGITAGIGGLAYAGMPATHRDTNHSVIFLTGHDATGNMPATSTGRPSLWPPLSSSCTWR